MNISVSLTPALVDMIKAKVEGGLYRSTSDVVREALRLLERADRQEADYGEHLRRAWNEGVESGDAGPLDFAELKKAARLTPEHVTRAMNDVVDAVGSEPNEFSSAASRQVLSRVEW